MVAAEARRRLQGGALQRGLPRGHGGGGQGARRRRGGDHQSTEEAAFKAYLAAAAQGLPHQRLGAGERGLGGDGRAELASGTCASRPDEVYYEPCAWKAGFARQLRAHQPGLARVAEEARAGEGARWRRRSRRSPAPPYKARDGQVQAARLHRHRRSTPATRATRTAPPSASRCRTGARSPRSGGRTVAMTNLYTDPDSRQTLKRADGVALLHGDRCEGARPIPRPALMTHGAARGRAQPRPGARVQGEGQDATTRSSAARSPRTLEELKAQTAALYFTEWLVEKKLLTPDEAERRARARRRLGLRPHLARHVRRRTARRKNYSQLASIQLGALRKAGALVWKAEEKAANGKDTGCFEIDLAKWRPAVDGAGEARCSGIKARGDARTPRR